MSYSVIFRFEPPSPLATPQKSVKFWGEDESTPEANCRFHISFITCKCIFTYFRAIFFPFKSRIRSLYVAIVSLAIILCPLAFQTYTVFYVTIYKHIDSGLSYRNNKTVFREVCKNTLEHRFLLSLIMRSIGAWAPMMIIVVTRIMMFLKLKKEALMRSQSTSRDTNTQMQHISKTFTLSGETLSGESDEFF